MRRTVSAIAELLVIITIAAAVVIVKDAITMSDATKFHVVMLRNQAFCS